MNIIHAQEDKRYMSFEEAFKQPDKVYILDVNPLQATKKVINGVEHYDNRNLKKIKALPVEIKKLINIRKLILTNFDFEKFPEIIFELNNLEYLGFDACNLKEIPHGITKLKNLKYLSISGDRLTKLPFFISELSMLEKLDISGNLITELPPELGQLKNLKCFENDYHSRKEYFCPIPDTILSLDSLKKITLFANQKILITELKKLSRIKNLKELNLFIQGADSLPKELFELTGLEILKISCDKFVPLPDDFKKLKNLKDLFFRNHPGEYGYDDQKKIRELLPNCKEIDI